MMREWATVVSWQNGVAILHSTAKTSCQCCAARKGCGSSMLNKLGPKNAHIIQVISDRPLQPGQRVELGIKESSLLTSALLVYMTPLVGLFAVAALFQFLFSSDLATAGGALLGGTGGFIMAKGIALLVNHRQVFQPIVLGVTLPSDMLHVEDGS